MRKSLRFAVLNRDAFQCQYCGRSAPWVELEVDHVEPRARGGPDTLGNLVTACYDCNRGKKHYLLSRGARMALEGEYDPSDDFEDRYILAEASFAAALEDAYQRGVDDQILREAERPPSRPLPVSVILYQLARSAERIQ